MTRRDFLIGTSLSPLIFSSVFGMANNSLETELLGLSNQSLVGNGYLLRTEASNAFIKMAKSAKMDGIVLQAVSSYRSFDQQVVIWNRKYNKYESQGLKGLEVIDKITQYSSLPGTSRHHWGTEMDLIDGSKKIPSDPLNEKHFLGKGIYAPMKKWMDAHASDFGFVEVYTNQAERTGFKYEPWHFSYSPLSTGYLSVYLGINYQKISEKFISLKGNNYLTEAFLNDYKQKYLLGINPILKSI